MIVKEIVELICTTLSKPDEGTKKLCKQYLNAQHKFIYGSQLWQESLIELKVKATGKMVVLPSLVEFIQGVKTSNGTIYNSLEMNAIKREEGPTYTIQTPVGLAEMPDDEVLEIFSTDALDVDVDVSILGGDGPLDSKEVLKLSGTTPVRTALPYKIVHSFSKGKTNGTVIVRGARTGKDLQRLSFRESMRQHVRIELNPSPTPDTELIIVAKKKCPELDEDLDVPALSGIDNALIAFTEMKMYEYMRQFNKSAAKGTEASALLKVMREQENSQKQRNLRIF